MLRLVSLGSVIVLVLLSGCVQQAPVTEQYSAGLDLFFANQLDSAYGVFEKVIQTDPRNAECTAYLAETARRLNRQEDAIYHANRALVIDSCNSFAHVVLAETYNPLFGETAIASFDSVWVHAQKAIDCNPGDGNAWLILWTEAIRRGDRAVEDQAVAELDKSGFFSDAVIEYNRWVLDGLPPNAILLTNGDLDTYPAVMLQSVRKVRPDVAIVNLALLNTDWYEHYVESRYGLPVPLSDSLMNDVKPYQSMDGEVVTVACQKLEGWTAQIRSGALSRPLTPGITVYNNNISPRCRNHLSMMGSYFQFSPELTEPAVDWAAAKAAFDRANLELYRGDFVGRNDRSPIRHSSGFFPVMNLCSLGLDISRNAHKNGDQAGALKYLRAAKELAAANQQLDHFRKEFDEVAAQISN